jgi:thioredoxin-related protein
MAGRRTLPLLPRPGGRRLAALLSALVLLALARTAPAEEVMWRSSYNAARREAQEKSRPLVLDFGTENCVWCNKLDSSTFRDPKVVSVLNEHFIPIKIDAQQNATLAEALNIQSYPTLVLASPDGKILDTLEGYQDAPRFHDRLQRVLVTFSSPEWMNRDYQEASKAIGNADYARAVALLKGVVEDGKDRPVQAKARQLLQDLEQQAANRLARARQHADKGQNADALDVLTDLLRTFPGTQAAADGGRMISRLAEKPEVKTEQRTKRARELLAQAREDYRTQQYLCCMDRCEVLAGSYADLPEGVEAIQLANEIKNNPEWMREACESLSERLGMLYLALAETWLKKGQPQQAVLCLERVVQAFPGTRQADAAQMRLSQVMGRPTQRADFKKSEGSR